jgi:F1F0 ATPase subunit 2
MIMNEPFTLTLAGVAGLLIGTIFFGGLWWTIRRGMASPRPALWFLGSLLLRMSIALAGFYFVSGGQWQRLLPCLLGFAISRPVVIWLTRPSRNGQPTPTKEAHHAS